MAKIVINGIEVGFDPSEEIQSSSTIQTVSEPITFTGEDSIIQADPDDSSTGLLLKTADNGSYLNILKNDSTVTSTLRGSIVLNSCTNLSTATNTPMRVATNYPNSIVVGEYYVVNAGAANVGSATSPAYANGLSTNASTSMRLTENPHQYIHQILMTVALTDYYAIRFDLINSSSAAITNSSAVAKALYEQGHTSYDAAIPCSGWEFKSTSDRDRFYSIFSTNGSNIVLWRGKNETVVLNFNNWTVNDTPLPLN